jgi:uncharacterized ferritin-like protein (DUF455 family)
MVDLYQQLEAAILEPDTRQKCAMTEALYRNWRLGDVEVDARSPILAIDDPGRPARPLLVDPRNLKRRSVASVGGRIILLHAFAHIEFNAINIALDAAYRFRDLPRQYTGDWLRVAREEACHFQLLDQALVERNSYYGAFPAHRGLWDMVCKTRHDALLRMALVPRVMEARGLDVTPAMIDKFQQVGDAAAVAILKRIYRDEIEHVRIGNFWYQTLCEHRQLDPVATFRCLLDEYMGGPPRGPFNWPARIQAGFAEQELSDLERGI